MAEYSGFFDAEEITNPNGSKGFDREYFANNWANYFSLFIGNGVFINPTNQLKILAIPGLNVKMLPGWAFIDGYWYHNDSEKTISIPPNLTASTVNYSIHLTLSETAERKIIQEQWASTGALATGQIRLAMIKIKPGASAIYDSDITDTRPDENQCGFVKGLVDVIDTNDLFLQFTNMFNTWFDGMKGKLSTDAAGNLQTQINSTNAQVALKANQTSLDATNANVADLSTNKADKSEVTNVMTPKGNIAYASLPATGNTVGWYYYCPDGDGTHGAGNYVWNGTAWYFGGTGDEGYSILGSDLSNLKAGTEVLNSTFVRGNLNADGTVNASILYRVSVSSFLRYDRDIVLNIPSGYYLSILVFDSSYLNPVRTGAITGTHNVAANTIFKIGLSRVTENTSEVADLSIWSRLVTIGTKLQGTLNLISSEIDSLSSVVGITVSKHFYGSFIRGNLNTDGITINTDITYRVASTSFMKFPKSTNITVASGIYLTLFTYDVNYANPVRTGSITGNYTIPANTYFKICILRQIENTSEVADIDAFVKSITINGVAGNVDDRLSALELINGSSLGGKTINALGDSITSTDYITPNWWQMIASENGCFFNNYGVSGTCIAHNEDREINFGQCLAKRYITMNTSADGNVVMGGTNDHLLTPRGSWDSTDIATLFGALNVMMNGLLTNFNGKPLLFCTPIPRKDSYLNFVQNPLGALMALSDTDTMTVQLIAEAIKTKCTQYGIPCLDLFGSSGINGVTTIYYNGDMWHPSAVGQSVLRREIGSKLTHLFS